MKRNEEIARYLHAIFLNPASKLNGVEASFFESVENDLREVAAGVEAICDRHGSSVSKEAPHG